MTVQNAIKILKTEYLGDSEYIELAKQMGAYALEKQIPQKVIEKVDELNDKEYNGLIKRLYCPNCHNEIDEYNSPVGCKFCLQTLDWRNENDN